MISQSIPVIWYVIVAFILFSVGIAGLLLRRNAIVLLLCIELMLNAANLVLVAFSGVYKDLSPQIFVFFVLIVAAAEAAVGLAILALIFKNRDSADVSQFSRLKW